MKSKIQKIRVLSGNYKGVNIIKQHIKPHDNNPKGEIIKRESPIYLSQISVVDQDSGPRIVFHIKDGKKFRIAKRSGKILLSEQL